MILMTFPTVPNSKILQVTLTLSNYPILAKKIRRRMRELLFVKGIIGPDVLEEEVERKAIATQQAEGLVDPIRQESEEDWQERLNLIRDYLTDFYFAYNMPFSTLKEIIQEAINENRSGPPMEIVPTFNPELAPWYLLFEQAEKYATYPPEMFEAVKHHYREIIVVLVKGQISDQLAFVRIAREFIDIFDLKEIKRRKIGRGKIGGKAAGMYLAYKILTRPEEDDEFNLNEYLAIPETYYLGSDVFYNFTRINRLAFSTSHKYRSREEIEREYPRLKETYMSGRFPEDIVEKLRQLLEQLGKTPLIVRSSSLLEDNFGSAFAGKYDSYFLPNQGTTEENLQALLRAVALIYASVLSPDALFYRQIQGLDDYDERMAILIQKVEGEQHGRYYFPFIAGVGFSRNPFIWNSKLRREDGFLRIVFGLGTRAVERVEQDYPRMIGLSHPLLRPVKAAAEIKKYSQRWLDVIDLEENAFKTIPVSEVLSTDFPGVQYLASVDEGDFVRPIYSLGQPIPPEKLVLTFDNLIKNTDFVPLMKQILRKLERHYERPVDIEFTVQLIPGYPKPGLRITLLQCRPLSNQVWADDVPLPANVAAEDRLFTSARLVSQGVVERIRYIVFVDPETYHNIPEPSTRLEIARVIGRLNQRLEGQNFILIGPGRWGSSNIELGVKVTYADIYNTRMLIEMAMNRNGVTPEVSYGTHFFQDLVESRIYPLALYPEDPEAIVNMEFFQNAPNLLPELLPRDAAYAPYVKVIDVQQVSRGKLLRVVMNAEEGKAIGYLHRYDPMRREAR
ncbi:MAG: phosphoenolpyruvate synthase [Chloroflexi bacterium]|nr:MAG: phosphoenolpyruvate synthase [Chloroflexota bacterium]